MIKKCFASDEKLNEIAGRYPTPFYLYDEEGIRKNARRLREAFAWNAGFKEYFAEGQSQSRFAKNPA